MGLTNEEEKLAKDVAILKRDYHDPFHRIVEQKRQKEKIPVEPKLKKIRGHVFSLLRESLEDGSIDPREIAARLPEYLAQPVINPFYLDPLTIRHRQVARLKEIGYPIDVLSRVSLPSQDRSNALLVIPENVIPLEKQLELTGIRAGDRIVWERFKPYHPHPDTPYWIYEVRIELPDKKTCEYFEQFRMKLNGINRRGGTFMEGIHLFAQNPIAVINSYGYKLLGCYYANEIGAPTGSIPGISVWTYPPNNDISAFTISPNSYGGETLNGDSVLTCANTN